MENQRKTIEELGLEYATACREEREARRRALRALDQIKIERREIFLDRLEAEMENPDRATTWLEGTYPAKSFISLSPNGSVHNDGSFRFVVLKVRRANAEKKIRAAVQVRAISEWKRNGRTFASSDLSPFWIDVFEFGGSSPPTIDAVSYPPNIR